MKIQRSKNNAVSHMRMVDKLHCKCDSQCVMKIITITRVF